MSGRGHDAGPDSLPARPNHGNPRRDSLTTTVPPQPVLPPAVEAEGPAGRFAWEEFFQGQLRNPHTRALYLRSVTRFLKWIEPQGVPLPRVTPGMIGAYLDQHPGSVPTRKAELAGLRRFFDLLVSRHVVVLNPAASVRGERYQVVEGLTPRSPPPRRGPCWPRYAWTDSPGCATGW